ncbi:MAG: zinc ribbon domain-containing protein [Oscillospiraceae bacterium]|nr:zinc ribbon domain-containing protein [Oscillospiraceae bacterium]
MKCQHCGSNLNIEDSVCPYCGQPNPFAEKHQEAMRRFESDYEKTKRDVLEQTARFSKHTIRITILAVLVALIAGAAIFLIKADDIRWRMEEKRVESNASEHRAAISELMEERDYLALYSYFSKTNTRYSDALKEYDAVCDCSFQYRLFYDNLMMLQAKKADPDNYRYYTETELLEDIANEIRRINECMEPQTYNEEAYTEEKMTYMEDLRDSVETMVEGYFGLSREEVMETRGMTVARINVLLEDSYGK